MSNTVNDAAAGEGWAVGLRVWVERAGRAVLGPEQLEALEAIDRHGSLSAAARALGLHYRRVWELVQQVNEAAGEPLVQAATGGVQGGGAALTPLGRWAVAALRDSQGHLRRAATGLAPLPPDAAPDRPLHVFAAVSLDEVLACLLADFAAAEPGTPVRAVFGASDELAHHLLTGSLGDLFLTADPGQLDRLRPAHLLLPGPVALAENRLAAVALEGTRLGVRRPADLARDGLRVALAGADCPLGRYTRAYLDGLHVYDAVARSAVSLENSRAVLAAVRAGRADVGLAYSSDAARAARCRTLFVAQRPADPIRYSAGVLGRGNEAAARRLLAFLTSAAAGKRFRQCGFLPSTP